MNKIETVMKQGLEELDALHKNRTTPVSRAEFHSWLKAHDKHLLDAVVAEVRRIDNDWNGNGEHYANVREALQDIETLINNSTGV